MADPINLTASVRGNLLTLQRTSSLIASTQTRLSTGLKINSALDDAAAFFLFLGGGFFCEGGG